MDKVKKSTSASLGLRLCGMQVYHPTEREFQFRDKYHGRQIDTYDDDLICSLMQLDLCLLALLNFDAFSLICDIGNNSVEFENTLVEYLHNRVHFREDLIPLFVERLEAFKKVIGLQSEYRFYSSSLLMLYEGLRFQIPSSWKKFLEEVHYV